MAVQDSSEYKISCPRCFAVVPGESPFCPECGYNLGDSEGSDTAVYQDLAQANLSRMRGDKQGAIDQCLKVLRAFPNNVTAHSLLGEIYMEHGELKQAAEWFEMALDLEPNAVREKQLLIRVQKQMDDADHKATLQQLEVKPRSGLTALWAGMVAIVLIVGLASFFIGRNAGGGKAVAANEEAGAEPIRIPATGDPKPAEPNSGQSNPAPTQGSAPGDDHSAATAIFAKAQKSSIIETILVNPATQEVILTGRAEPDVPFETTALMLAADVFVGRGATRSATIRLVKDGKIAFVGTLARDTYDELQGNSGQTPLDDLGVMAFPTAWHADASTRPGSPVRPNPNQGTEPAGDGENSSEPEQPTEGTTNLEGAENSGG